MKHIRNAWCASVWFAAFLVFGPEFAIAQTSGGGVNPDPNFHSINIATTGGSINKTAGRLTLNETIQQLGTGTNIFTGTMEARKVLAANFVNNAGNYVAFTGAPGGSDYGYIGQASVASGGGVSGNHFFVTGVGTNDLIFGAYSGGFGKEVFRIKQSNRTMTCKSDSTGTCRIYGDATNDMELGANLQKVLTLSATSGHNQLNLFTDNSAGSLGRIVDGTNCGGGVGDAGLMCLEGTNGVILSALSGSSVPQFKMDATTLNYKLNRINFGAASTSATFMLIDSNTTANKQKGRIKEDEGLSQWGGCNDAESTCTNAFSFTHNTSGNVDNIAILENVASGTIDIRGDTISIFDHAGGNTAAVQINSSNVCTQATGCSGVGGAKFAGGRINTSGTLQSGSVNVTSTGKSGTGDYTVDLTAAGFSDVPSCTAVSTDTPGSQNQVRMSMSSATAGRITNKNDADSFVDTNTAFTCIGT